MYPLLSRLLPMQEDDDFLDDMFNQEPNGELLTSLSPFLGVIISILLGLLLLIGVALTGVGGLQFFAASGNAPKQAAARSKVVGGILAIVVAVVGWSVFGDVLRAAMEGL